MASFGHWVEGGPPADQEGQTGRLGIQGHCQSRQFATQFVVRGSTSVRSWEISEPMVNQQIDKIKREYTDKYVAVDASRPELARFGDLVGQVKTVNMSGRALVEFIDYHLNLGWFDIDLDYLKVVDKPLPKETKKPAAKKPAPKPAAKQAESSGEKKLSPLEMARMQGAGGKPAAKAKAKPSTADILAAARGATAPAAKSEPKASAPVAPAKAASGKVDRSKMSVAEMIAYCREKDAQ